MGNAMLGWWVIKWSVHSRNLGQALCSVRSVGLRPGRKKVGHALQGGRLRKSEEDVAPPAQDVGEKWRWDFKKGYSKAGDCPETKAFQKAK